jgi:hypothetical protein
MGVKQYEAAQAQRLAREAELKQENEISEEEFWKGFDEVFGDLST